MKRSRKLLGAAALILALVALPAAAVGTRYCWSSSVGGCLQHVHCDYYVNGQYVGSIDIDYDCRV